MNGDAIDYATMVHGERGADVVMAGRASTVRELTKVLKRLPPESRPDG